MEVYVDDEAKLTLHGLQQHYVKLKENEKNKKLFELLDILEFNQVSIDMFYYNTVYLIVFKSTFQSFQDTPGASYVRESKFT